MTEIDRTTEIDINGMTCSHCVKQVDSALRNLPGTKNVSILLESSGTSVATVVSDIVLDDVALREAVDEAGYHVAEIRRDI